jgi:hypothetical protein
MSGLRRRSENQQAQKRREDLLLVLVANPWIAKKLGALRLPIIIFNCSN